MLHVCRLMHIYLYVHVGVTLVEHTLYNVAMHTRSTLQKERLTLHGFGNRISCAFLNAALPYKKSV